MCGHFVGEYGPWEQKGRGRVCRWRGPTGLETVWRDSVKLYFIRGEEVEFIFWPSCPIDLHLVPHYF